MNSNYINFFIFLKRIISTLGYHSIPYQKYNCTRDLEAPEETWPVKFETQNGPTRMPKSIIENKKKRRQECLASERVGCLWWAHRVHQTPCVALCSPASSAVRTYGFRQFSVGVLLPFVYQFSPVADGVTNRLNEPNQSL